MLRIALTGGIGCGKTSVCQLFSERRVPIIDSDMIARELVQPGQPALQQIIEHFGPEILLADGSLNRKALAAISFSEPDQRQQLEAILHPRIAQTVDQRLSELNAPYAIIAIPLLFETGQQKQYDRVLLVDCKEQQQIQRTLQRDQRSLDEIRAIMDSQYKRQQRIEKADDIIDNSRDRSALEAQVEELHQKYIALANTV